MTGNLESGTAMVSSESRVDVEDNGDVDSELHTINDDSEVSQPSPSPPPERHSHYSVRFQ
jgi:hypothetical protein